MHFFTSTVSSFLFHILFSKYSPRILSQIYHQNFFNSNAIKTEPTNTSEPGALAVEKISNKIGIKQQFNENDSMACQNCIDQKFEIQELNQKLEIQTSLAEYWKAIALKYEPDHKDPNRSFDHAEKVTTELLEIPPPPPLPDKVFKRKYSSLGRLIVLLLVY